MRHPEQGRMRTVSMTAVSDVKLDLLLESLHVRELGSNNICKGPEPVPDSGLHTLCGLLHSMTSIVTNISVMPTPVKAMTMSRVSMMMRIGSRTEAMHVVPLWSL